MKVQGNVSESDFCSFFFEAVHEVTKQLETKNIDALARDLIDLRETGGRLFVLGVGGSAGNASHAVNDFRKLCGIEAYAPTDNVSELSARANDDGWDRIFVDWLKISRLSRGDALLIFSVGGGDLEKNVSTGLIKAVDLSRDVGAKVLGIVGRDGGHVKKFGDNVIVIPTVEETLITPLTEAYQAVVWHCLVSYPGLQIQNTKW